MNQSHIIKYFECKYKLFDFNARDKGEHKRILEKVSNMIRLH